MAAFSIAWIRAPQASLSHRCTLRASLRSRTQVVEKLRVDLKRQYRTPRQLDWSIYDNDVSFDDPVTQLSGIVAYKVRASRISFYCAQTNTG